MSERLLGSLLLSLEECLLRPVGRVSQRKKDALELLENLAILRVTAETLKATNAPKRVKQARGEGFLSQMA